MRRRDFARLVGALIAWPFAVHGQQTDKGRRIGVLTGYAEGDPQAQARLAAFKSGLAELGWNSDRSLALEVRWTGADPSRASTLARELVASSPDVIVSSTTPATLAIRKETSAIPIVFVLVSDPVGSGFATTLSHPGGNATGLSNIASSMAGKWVQLLREIAPGVRRVTVMFNPKTAPYEYYRQSLEAAATGLDVKLFRTEVLGESDFRRVIPLLAARSDNGLLVLTDSFAAVHRKPIITLAAQYKVPAIYAASGFVEDGGLVSYGPDVNDLFKRGAGFVDRILRGARPGDLPVEQPTKYELAVNRTTAKALGLKVSDAFFARADRVIE